MPVHDWTRVDAGIFHHFHQRWIAQISDALNSGLLPPDYYALDGHVVGDSDPDVARTEVDQYALKQNSVVIRHKTGDHVVALVEAVSPENKSSRHNLNAFVAKGGDFLYRGCHLMVLDLHPPTARDPNGIHGAIWEEIADGAYQQPAERPLTLASYAAGSPTTAYVEPVAVGDALTEMPLFLETERYVSVPLGAAYLEAWNRVPERWRQVLERPIT